MIILTPLIWGLGGSGFVCTCDYDLFTYFTYHIYLYAPYHLPSFFAHFLEEDREKSSFMTWLYYCFKITAQVLEKFAEFET